MTNFILLASQSYKYPVVNEEIMKAFTCNPLEGQVDSTEVSILKAFTSK